MAAAWRRGERPTADQILKRHPEIASEAAVRLIYEEVCLRRESGQEVETTEVVRRYPRWRADLEPLLGCDRLMRPPASRTVAFPEVGELLGDFRLLAELGRGAAGRTFLAAQPSLAERPVVLKVTARDHDEHLSLARLQHTHIVPLYSAQVFPDRGLRAICMPFLGGANLAQILDDLAGIPVDRRTGRDVLGALDRLGTAPTPTAGPFRQFLDQASYVQAVCWIAACLADALQYAHEHDLVHMDVKPSNVLIAGDGQPMLLDFHLAGSPLVPEGEPADRLGGTPGWTSPEQDAAMKALAAGRAIERGVDGRTDLYSLGLLLYEALGGAGAFEAPEQMRLDRRNSRVSPGMADIVHKCLEHEPAARYRDASILADDLRRHLNDLPLRGVPNRSVMERWRKWRRRRPDALSRRSARLTVMVAVVALGALGWGSYRERVGVVEDALADARRLGFERHYDDAVRTAERGLALARQTFGVDGLIASLEEQLRLSRRGRKADELHELADRVRFRYGAAPAATDEMRALAPRLRRVWDERAALTSGDGLSLDAEIQRRLEVDLLELAVVWADLRVRLAGAEELGEARRDALGVLDQAEAAFGTSPALARERQALAEALGLPETGPPAHPAARSAWEHYTLGRSYLRSGQLPAAAEEFQRTLELRPQDFWPNFYQGLCAYRLGRFEDALAAFRACVTLSPNSAECRVNRALAFERLGRSDEALRDYDRALTLDTHLAEAYLNRGILSLRSGRPNDALDDLHQALRNTDDRETAARIRYNLALTHLAAGDRASAEAEARQAVSLGSTDARAMLAKPVKRP